MDKSVNNRAWFLVMPVVAVVAFNAVLPLMTVINYSVQDTFGNNQFFWNGVGWYQELLDPNSDLGGRFHNTSRGPVRRAFRRGRARGRRRT